MKTSLRRSLAGAAMVAAIALGTAGAATAEVVGPAQLTVPPGGRGCVTTTQRANFKVRADGSAPTAVGSQVQWTLHESFDGVNYQTVTPVTGTGNYYAAELASNLYPQYFPSYWRLCARNLGTTSNVKATLTLKTDYDAV